MDGSKEICEESETSVHELDEIEPDEPSPYDSDTEDIDVDEFVKSLPRDINQWGIYQVDCFNLEKIGDGFFGEIFKATELKTKNVMVMKTMKKASKMKLMCAEIRLMSRLSHPNILRFLGVCVDIAGIHLLTAYMDIGNLEEVVLDAREPLPWSLRMKLAHDISKGMAYLHAVGVIHRDLASKNILISKESGGYLAVVGDFGLAAKIPSRKTRLNVVGSPYWMAPEVLRHDQYNETVDIFSYGIILCEIIGRVHSSPDEIPRTNQYGLDVDTYKFRELVEGCPPEFLQLAVCCCQLEPESRPPFEVTAKFLEHIRQFTIVEGSPVKLTQDKCNGSLRLSANIEDWIIDSKKIMEPTKNLPSWGKFCVCENDTTVIAHGTFEEKSSREKKNPCHSNKRHSFFSGIRYKYFTPSTVTEDLVKSTPRKLAWFFNRVLHVQKKHKFDGSKKRSKTLNSTDGSNRPTLRSYRLFGSSRDCNSTEARPRKVVNEHFHEGEEGIRTRSLSCHDSVGLSYNSKVGFVETPKMSSEPSYGFALGVGSGTNAFTNQTNSPASSYITEARLATAVSPPSSDYVDFSNASGCDADNPFVMSWPQTSLQKATNFSKSGDMNGFHEEEMSIPRRYSASDINVNGEMKSSKSRTFSTRQYPKGTKNRKYRSFFNFFQKHGKEKQST